MKKILSILLLTLCISGCGELTISYKASHSHSKSEEILVPPGKTSETPTSTSGTSTTSFKTSDSVVNIVPTKDDGVEYYQPGNRTDTYDYLSGTFYRSALSDGYYLNGKHYDCPRGSITTLRNITPQSIIDACPNVELYLVNDATYFLMVDEKVYLFDDITNSSAGLSYVFPWDYDENGTFDIFSYRVIYSGLSGFNVRVDFFDMETQSMWNAFKYRYPAAKMPEVTFVNDIMYINGNELFYRYPNMFCCGIEVVNNVATLWESTGLVS